MLVLYPLPGYLPGEQARSCPWAGAVCQSARVPRHSGLSRPCSPRGQSPTDAPRRFAVEGHARFPNLPQDRTKGRAVEPLELATGPVADVDRARLTAHGEVEGAASFPVLERIRRLGINGQGSACRDG